MSGKLNIHEGLNNVKSTGAKVYHVFTREDCGCYADGSHGDVYVTRRAVKLAALHGYETDALDPTAMWEQAGEEADAAVDHLNTLCEAGISFQFIDGDLVLISDEEADC